MEPWRFDDSRESLPRCRATPTHADLRPPKTLVRNPLAPGAAVRCDHDPPAGVLPHSTGDEQAVGAEVPVLGNQVEKDQIVMCRTQWLTPVVCSALLECRARRSLDPVIPPIPLYEAR